MESSLTSLHMYIWYGRLPTRFWLMHPNWDWLFTISNDNHMCQWTHNKSQKIDLIDILSIVFYPPLLHTWCWMTCLGSMEPDLDLLFAYIHVCQNLGITSKACLHYYTAFDSSYEVGIPNHSHHNMWIKSKPLYDGCLFHKLRGQYSRCQANRCSYLKMRRALPNCGACRASVQTLKLRKQNC